MKVRVSFQWPSKGGRVAVGIPGTREVYDTKSLWFEIPDKLDGYDEFSAIWKAMKSAGYDGARFDIIDRKP